MSLSRRRCDAGPVRGRAAPAGLDPILEEIEDRAGGLCESAVNGIPMPAIPEYVGGLTAWGNAMQW